jgi:hypothetical protein
LESQRLPSDQTAAEGFKFSASYCVTDNARPHSAKVILDFIECNAMKRVSHRRYSPDLAPSDFYLFGHVKQLPRGYEFADRETFLHTIEDLWGALKK